MTAPRWPRLMKRKTAAEYCDLSESAFEGEVLAGKLPAPISIGRRDHWDRMAIDAAINRLTGGANDDDMPDYRRRLREQYGSPEAA